MVDDAPDVVPERLTASVDYKIIAAIIVGVLTLQIIITYVIDDPTVLVYASSLLITLSVAILSFVTARKYSKTLVYDKAFTALGIGFLGLFFGEFVYFIYEQFLGLDPYPSIADIFFYLLYVMTIIYLVLNIRFFAIKMSIADKLLVSVIHISITTVYIILSSSWIVDYPFDFYYGVIFVAGISITLGLSVYGVRIFQKGLMGTSWVLLTLGILLFTVGDTWYYYLEVFEAYDLKHPVLSLWYGGYLLIMYSLFHHRKTM